MAALVLVEFSELLYCPHRFLWQTDYPPIVFLINKLNSERVILEFHE
jgi:hypothetical protein